MDTLYTKAYIKEHNDGGFTAIASTEAEDRMGEVMEVQGWDLKDFKQNPILLAFHDHTKPIGKVTKIWVEKAAKPKLMFKGWISDATETARGVKRLMADGVLSAFSVGFKPLDMDGNRFTKQQLLEISVVSVPANQEALMLAYKSLKGNVSEEVMNQLGVPAGLLERLDDLESRVETVVKGLSHLNPHQGRSRIAKERATYLKVIERAASASLSEKRLDPVMARRIKVIKQATDTLIRSNKGDLHG